MKIKDPESLAKWVGKLSFENKTHTWLCLSTPLFEPSFKTASQVQPYLMSHGQVQPCFTSQWSQYGPNGLKGPKLGLSMVKHHSVLPPNAMILRYTTPAAFHFFPQLDIKLLLAGGPRCLDWYLLIPCILMSLPMWTKVLGLISFDSLYFVSRYNPVHYIMISWPRWTKMLGSGIMDIFQFLVFWCHDNPVHYIMIFSKS